MTSPSERERIIELARLVSEQAADEGLWFFARTAPEGYLQQELRRLHAAVERLLGKDVDDYLEDQP